MEKSSSLLLGVATFLPRLRLGEQIFNVLFVLLCLRQPKLGLKGLQLFSSLVRINKGFYLSESAPGCDIF